jgi:hypothetical protein
MERTQLEWCSVCKTIINVCQLCRPKYHTIWFNAVTLTNSLSFAAFVHVFFGMFVEMTDQRNHIKSKKPFRLLILDMSDCYTWSFPEFIPFCPQLYYFSSLKVFKTLAPA